MPLLIHSLAEFSPFLLGLVDRCAPKSVLEIGSETGGFSKQLYDRCKQRGAELITVEPKPAKEVIALAETSDSFHLFAGKSLPYLLQEGCRSDFVFLDGDHNWFTVFSELSLIHRAWEEKQTSGVIVLHDVGWPSARRDAYCDPNDLPKDAVRPYTYDHGVTVDSPGVITGGFRGEGSFAWAINEGGPCNGVLTAVEDFNSEHPEYNYRSIDAVFGLGVLTRAGTREDEIVAEMIAPYQNSLVRTLEKNRLELYLKVIELQDALARRAA